MFVYFLKQYSDDNGIFNDLSMTLFDMLKCELKGDDSILGRALINKKPANILQNLYGDF